MKKIVLLLLVLFSLNTYSQNFTFELDLSLYNGASTSVEFFRAGTSYPMTNTGGNIYSYTTFIPPFQLSNYTYKFKVDGVFESFTTLLSCLTIVNNDTLRAINLNTTTPSVVCWESCSACATAIPGCTDPTANNYSSNANLDDGSCLYNVTFFVDMSETTQSFITPEVFGTFNAWCGGCATMTDFNNDSIWEITIPLTVGSYQYKFAADNATVEESLYENDNCVATAFGYTNRTLNVVGNQVLDTVCWNRCYSCDIQRNFYNVTFSVDMSNVTNTFTAPEVNGTFNNWCGNCWSLDNPGNNIYSRSFNIDTSLHTFKFSADNWNIEENLDSALSCVDLGFDSLGSLQYVNRSLRATSDTIINVCWESCNTCPIFGCTNPSACNYDSLATLDDGSCLTVYGCMNLTALNYDSLATCPDSCFFFQIIYGCTDSMACNFNILANTDDSSCLLNYGCMDSLAYNYDSLAVCFDSSCVYEYNVTFQLDLRGQTNISYTTPEINGLFNGWCGNCAELTDINNDSIWEITVPILEGSGPVSGVPGWEYKFSADNWNIQENLFSGDPCTFSAFGYTNRYINVTQDTILDPVCWGSCNDCFAPQTSYNLTFRLDMSQYIGIPFITPEINGTFNNWCGNCWPMTDDDGDNIWEFTTLIDSSLHEYKFSTDNWSLQELLDSSLYCVTSTIDSSGNVFVNRELKIYSDTILDIACWNECDSCTALPNSLLNINDIKLSIYPNPSNGLFYIKSNDFIDRIVVYDILSKKLFEVSHPELVTEIDLSNKKANVLLIETYIDGKVSREKLIIIK